MKGQGDAQSQEHAAPDVPQVGKKPSRWHPIKRLWWRIKKWAADKAAKVFGWIQEQIASMVLQHLCGVSMGDMKAYTTALHHKMAWSAAKGDEGKKKAADAIAAEGKVQNESKSNYQQALDDAKECDANIEDANSFMKSIDTSEQDLVAEQARAATFLESLYAAVREERQRQAEERQKKNPAASTSSPLTAPAPAGSASSVWQKQKGLPAGAMIKVKGAAGYVAAQANKLVEQLTSTRGEQMSRLRTSLESKPVIAAVFDNKGIGDQAIEDLKTHVAPVATAMQQVQSATPMVAAAVKSHASTVRGSARSVDDAAANAHQALNWEFKQAYEAVAKLPTLG